MRLVSFVLLLPGFLSATEIPEGTHLLLRLVNSVSTRTARPGDRVYLRTASPIVVNGQFLVPVDSFADGVITHSVRSGRIKGRAELGIRIDSVTLPNGKTIRVSPQLSSVDSAGSGQQVAGSENEVKQGGTKGKDAERVAVTGAEGAAIGGIADNSWKGAGIGASIGAAVGLGATLLSRGREVELPHGATLDVTFNHPVKIE